MSQRVLAVDRLDLLIDLSNFLGRDILIFDVDNRVIMSVESSRVRKLSASRLPREKKESR